ncbi:MAG: hypothetical protein ACQETG_05715 [Thermodesulfobacteriota bacterium]
MKSWTIIVTAAVLSTAAIVSPAHAYVGPGLGAGTLAVIGGLVASVFLAVFALVWYPLKKILARIRSADDKAEEPSPQNGKRQ